MNRRKMLGSMALAGLATTIPFKSTIAQNSANPTNEKTNIPFKRFKLGDLELTIVTDGYIQEKPIQPSFAPKTPSATVKTLLADNFRSTEEIKLGMQILLIRKGKKLIMIDSGFGNGLPTTGLLPQSLASAGFKPSDITDIVLTHAHPDHISGLLTAKQQLAFPNAQLHIAKIEYDFWVKAGITDFANSELKNQPDFLNQVLGEIKKMLNTVKPKLLFYTAGDTLLDCIRLVAAPGHTPGLTLMNVFSGNEQLLHVADLIHDDVLLFAHPEWGYLGDTDLALATKSRIEILKRLAKEKTLTLAYHLPWPGLGHVRYKDNNAFEWLPQVYATP